VAATTDQLFSYKKGQRDMSFLVLEDILIFRANLSHKNPCFLFTFQLLKFKLCFSFALKLLKKFKVSFPFYNILAFL